jgi:glutamate racemase
MKLSKLMPLLRPIAVFDSGIGSYSIVEKIHRNFPNQNLVYLSDRASFPYGGKTPDQLFGVVSKAISFLEKEFNPESIVIASNVPSVTIMPRLKETHSTPLFGVFPPIKEALKQSKTKQIGVMGVESLVRNSAIMSYIQSQCSDPKAVTVINASNLVELVESGKFIFDSKLTSSEVRKSIEQSLKINPSLDTFTLSSTHLPWLTEYFQKEFPNFNFVDPADSVVKSLPISSSKSEGKILGLVTENNREGFSADDFDKMLKALNISIPMERVDIEKSLSNTGKQR